MKFSNQKLKFSRFDSVEVVTGYSSKDLNNNGSFYTDSSGRSLMKRRYNEEKYSSDISICFLLDEINVMDILLVKVKKVQGIIIH